MATNVSYVRFLRGTPTAFSKVAKKDPDTLYFISELNADSGDLYLGSKLIAGKNAVVKMSLGDLTNVIAGNVNDDGSLLVFDEDQGKWVVKKPEEVASIICAVMKGASATEDGKPGIVPQPLPGQQNLSLQGDGTWADPTANLRATVSTLIGNDGGMSVRQIAVDVLETALIPENAKESLDTLKEIADWIQSHPDDASNFNTRITRLEENVFDVVGDDGSTIISEGLVTKVGNLSTEMEALNTKVTNLNTDVRAVEKDINVLYDKLRWHEMDDLTGNVTAQGTKGGQ